MKILHLGALLILAAPLHQAQGERGREWPFGADRAAGLAGRGRDLYNLGLLGAKAWDADRPEPRSSGGGTFQLDPDERFRDDGPERLRVEILSPGGPAQEAGLQIGDVIVGVGSKSFGKGSFEPLARAMSKAAAGSGKGEISLRVEREGEKGTSKVTVRVPVLGKAAGKPTGDAGRRLHGERALAWLAERQLEEGGFPETLSGQSGAVVQTSIAGLAWIAGGSDLEQGPHAENLRRALPFVKAFLAAPSGFGDRGGAGANWDQTNWGFVHAAIFLGELHEHSPTDELRAALQSCADAIGERQEESGGWAHGPGGPNALGYVELNIMTGLALSGLGLARRAGCEVDPEVVERAVDYIDRSSSGGGVGYSMRPGQVGQGNIGRSAATWLGYVNLGLGKGSKGKQLAGYVANHVADPQGGHASLMQHVFLAGVAAAALGGKADKEFWKAMERDLVLALAPDGSLQPRPWHETTATGSNSDVSVGEVWTTACWAVVLLAEPNKDGGGLPAWCGR